MFEIETAKIFLDKSQVDTETIKQITSMAQHPSISHARIMPDCHKGNGCCIGFTCRLTNHIIPGIVGGDIGCGVAAHPLPTKLMSKSRACERIYKVIKNVVPMGRDVHAKPIITSEQYEPFYSEAKTEAFAFATAYKEKFGEDITPYIPDYSETWFRDLCKRIGSDFEYDLSAMGTLGGGNHFCECNETPRGETYLTVHTGSRNLGMKIAMYHNSIMRTPVEDEDTGIDPEHAGLTGQQAAIYYFDMIWAQCWARMNRRAIISSVLYELGVEFSNTSLIESVHNYIDFKDLVVRKGAIRAHLGELCIVALNMRDGILICRGKGNEDWNYSGPHGCGRIISRRSALAQHTKKDTAIAMKKFEMEMKDVYSLSICPETLDERPSVYRDMKIICESIHPSLDIVSHARTILNTKGF